LASAKRSLIDRILNLATPAAVEGDASPPRALADNLWVVDRRIRILGPLTLPTRMTIVRLQGGGLFLHSPCQLDAPTRCAVEALGPVACIVAPNTFHHLFVNDCANAFPTAQVYLAPGLRERRPEVRPGLTLSDTVPVAWQGEIDQLLFGPVRGVSEVVFVHPASRTLLLTDLAFNVRRAASRSEQWLWHASAAWRRFGPSRTVRWTLLRDATIVRPFVERVLQWDFDRIIVTHGDVVERGGRPLFEEAFAT
jgi:uncharacterized protein DUF4336